MFNRLNVCHGLFGACFVMGMVFSLPAHAQSLDAQMRFLLNNDCANLTGGGSARFAGTALSTICDGDGGGVGTSGGGAAGSAQTLGATVQNRRSERLEGEAQPNTTGSSIASSFNLGKGFSVFLSGNFEALNRDVTTFADGFDSTVLGGTFGGDYQINDKALAGAAVTFTNTNGDFDGGGNFDTNAYGVMVFGSFIPVPGFFIDLSGGYARNDFEVNRAVSFTEIVAPDPLISGTASSDSNGDVLSFRGLVGHDHTYGNVTVGPRVGLNYSYTSIDGYSESGTSGLELVYSDQTVHSLQSLVGVQGSMAVSTSYGVWVPQANADWIHEFENNQRFIEAYFALDTVQKQRFKFQTDTPVRNFANIGVGTVLILPNGLQPFVNFRAMLGNDQFDNYAGAIGIRIEGS